MTPLKYVHLCTQYLAGAPLAQMTTSVTCGMEAISLWHCWVAIEPSAHQDCWIDCISSFSWKYPIYSIWGSGQAYCLGQSSTLISWSANHLEVVLTLWADTKVLLEKEISISIKLLSADGTKKCSKISWYMAALTLDLIKHSGPTPADVTAPQIITDCGNFTLDFKQVGFCASPLFLQTLGPWFPN